jgi:hypothetical protein
VNTSNVDFFINGVKTNVTAITVNTNNLVSPAITCYASAGAVENCYVDYVQFRGTASGQR